MTIESPPHSQHKMKQTPYVKHELLNSDPNLEDNIYTTFVTQRDGQCKMVQSSRPYTHQTQTGPVQTQVRTSVPPPDKFAKIKETTETQNMESRTDFMSIKGVFGWTVIDNVNIPYILRNDKQFVSVRIVESKLLSRYPNVYPDDLGKQDPLLSFCITSNEAKLLNEINLHHCGGEYGRNEFMTKDLIVLLSDFLEFFKIVKKTFPDGQTARIKSESESTGWLQIQNTLTPYVKRNQYKFVPLSVIQYSAGLLNNETSSGNTASPKECALLNDSCRKARVDFTFSASTKLIQVDDLLKVASVEIVELPSSNPLKHAAYMELPTHNSTPSQTQKTKSTTQALTPSVYTHPFHLHPTNQVDGLKNHGKVAGASQNNHIRTQVTSKQHQNVSMVSMDDKRIYQTMPQHLSKLTNVRTSSSVTSGIDNGTDTAAVNSQINSMIQFNAKQAQLPRNGISGDQVRLTGPKHRTVQPGFNGMNNQVNVNVDFDFNRSPGVISSIPSPRLGPQLQHITSSCPSTRPPLSSTCILPSQFRVAGIQIPGNRPQPPFYGILEINQTLYLQRFPGANQPHSGILSHQGDYLIPKQIPRIVEPIGGNLISNPIKPYQVSDSQSRYQHVKKPHYAHQVIQGLCIPTGSQPSVTSTLLPTVSQIVVAPDNESTSANYTHAVPKQVIAGAMISASGSGTTSTPPQTVPATGYISQQVPTQLVSAPAGGAKVSPSTVVVSQANTTVHSNDIKGVSFNNKSVSCLHLDKPDRCGRYCLVEAVCKLYFNGYNVHEFIYALENILNITLLTCDDQEEKAFIRYYSIKVDTLKCNKLIKFNDLENFFPQMSYMFPDKIGKELHIHVQQDKVKFGMSVSQENNVINKLVAELEESMPGTVSEMVAAEKRKNDDMENGPSPKQQKSVIGTDEADDVIILD